MLKAHVSLRPEHFATGRTRHMVRGTEMPHPAQLRIVQFQGDDGYYLLYCTEAGDELSDTYHNRFDHALAQAEWEFGVTPAEWTFVTAG
jgi:hypothetical protein